MDLVNLSDYGASLLQRMHQEQTGPLASGTYEKIVTLINDFEKDLPADYEAGARLVTFGQTVQFNIISLGYQNPHLIWFRGELEDGSAVQLVQHISQLSFLLVAAKRKDMTCPRRTIGFEPPVE